LILILTILLLLTKMVTLLLVYPPLKTKEKTKMTGVVEKLLKMQQPQKPIKMQQPQKPIKMQQPQKQRKTKIMLRLKKTKIIMIQKILGFIEETVFLNTLKQEKHVLKM
jgi:hypothetical protein